MARPQLGRDGRNFVNYECLQCCRQVSPAVTEGFYQCSICSEYVAGRVSMKPHLIQRHTVESWRWADEDIKPFFRRSEQLEFV